MSINTDTLPERMKDLPIDARGFPVPWFVAWENGKPEFRAMDPAKFRRAIKEKLCWVCGNRLGVNLAFVAGPMCGINRTSAEPPGHRECALWSVQNCPFMNNPRMVRNESGLDSETLDSMAGFGIKRNPGVSMIWNTRQYEVFKVDNGFLIQMGEPESVGWWACGRSATRADVMESIDSGLPNLLAIAKTEKGGIEALEEARRRFDKWLPR
jgi:hypothetical protein